jgi:hypothetical protein
MLLSSVCNMGPLNKEINKYSWIHTSHIERVAKSLLSKRSKKSESENNPLYALHLEFATNIERKTNNARKKFNKTPLCSRTYQDTPQHTHICGRKSPYPLPPVTQNLLMGIYARTFVLVEHSESMRGKRGGNASSLGLKALRSANSPDRIPPAQERCTKPNTIHLPFQASR